ncbi:MAG: outer membrane protein assembly factor BamE [Pseudomonadota bacterium]
MKKLFLIGTALMLAGCVSMGTNYDAKAVESLQIGMTKAEVVRLLGQPTQTVTVSDGGQRLIWVHSTASMFGANARSVSLPFDRDGQLVDVPK